MHLGTFPSIWLFLAASGKKTESGKVSFPTRILKAACKKRSSFIPFNAAEGSFAAAVVGETRTVADSADAGDEDDAGVAAGCTGHDTEESPDVFG